MRSQQAPREQKAQQVHCEHVFITFHIRFTLLIDPQQADRARMNDVVGTYDTVDTATPDNCHIAVPALPFPFLHSLESKVLSACHVVSLIV